MIYTKTITEIQRLNDYKLNDQRNYADTTDNFLKVLKSELTTNSGVNMFTSVPMKHIKFSIEIDELKSLLQTGAPFKLKMADFSSLNIDSELEFIMDSFFCREQDVQIILNQNSTNKRYGVLSNFFISYHDNKAYIIASFWDDEVSPTDVTTITSIGVSGSFPEGLFEFYNQNYFPRPLIVTNTNGVLSYTKQDGTTYTGVVVEKDGLSFPDSAPVPHLGTTFSLNVTAEIIDDVAYGPLILENPNNANGKYRVKISTTRLFTLDGRTMDEMLSAYKDKYFFNQSEDILPQSIAIVTGTQFQIEGNGLVSRSFISRTNNTVSDKSGYLGYRKKVIYNTEHNYYGYVDEPFYRKHTEIVPISLTITASDTGFAMYIRDQSIVDNNNAFVCLQYPVSTVDDATKGVTKGSKVYTKYDPLFCLYKTSNAVRSGLFSSTVKYFIVREKDIMVPMEIHADASYGSLNTNPIMNLQFPVSITESNEYVINFPNNLASTRFVYPNAELDLVGYVSGDVLAEGSVITTSRFGETREYVGMQTVDDAPNSARILMFNRVIV